jgi:lipoate-protein ligase B
MTEGCVLLDLGLREYEEVWDLQRSLVARRLGDRIPDILILVEHPPVYTVGRRGTANGLEGLGLPVYEVERGGDVTYHGPGQLVGYPIMALSRGKLDVKRYVSDLEEILRRTVADFGISGNEGPHSGLWVGDRKLASIGIAVKHFVTYHGFALNVHPDMEAFRRIRPCGLEGTRMTSIENLLGCRVPMEAVKDSLLRHFSDVFKVDLKPASEDILERSCAKPFSGKA